MDFILHPVYTMDIYGWVKNIFSKTIRKNILGEWLSSNQWLLENAHAKMYKSISKNGNYHMVLGS
jgi:hypothetical protein